MILPLISPKAFDDYTAQEYHGYICSMWNMRTKGKVKAPSPAPGLTVTKTKKGALSVRRTKARAFAYVTYSEMAALSVLHKCSQADLWQTFKAKEYIITQSRMEAEQAYAVIKELPWE